MARIKSLIIRFEIDHAKKAHNCRRNARHRIARGDRRLKVHNGRNWHHYCLQCANTIVTRDKGILEELACDLSLESCDSKHKIN